MTFTANGKRQTSDSSWEFLKIENAQLKPVKNNCYRQTQREATNLGVEVMNSKAQVKEKLGHVVDLLFAVNVILNLTGMPNL